MEFRVLQYFLAVAREQSISGAAEYLHLSQPTLSRQLKDLEEELGKQLFIRGNRKITLTDEGMTLRKRAEEIMELVKKTEDEIAFSDEAVSGNVYIGSGETQAVRLLARAARQLQKTFPQICIHISSGDASDVTERLDKGLIDFGVLFDPINLSEYNHLRLPMRDEWGVLMRRDAALAKKETVTPEDLWDKPLIISRQQKEGSPLALWLKHDLSSLNIAATYSLLYNASLMVEEGIGYALCLNHIVNPTGESSLCFRPLSPGLDIGLNIVWKKYRFLNKASGKFLEKLRELVE
ncbi:MAG: LysR family transcriptional regulator [Alistipes sp.]|nr:LysR family transcriptional regulator [Alistipes sp.]